VWNNLEHGMDGNLFVPNPVNKVTYLACSLYERREAIWFFRRSLRMVGQKRGANAQVSSLSPQQVQAICHQDSQQTTQGTISSIRVRVLPFLGMVIAEP
jgi:hypothetical protein